MKILKKHKEIPLLLTGFFLGLLYFDFTLTYVVRQVSLYILASLFIVELLLYFVKFRAEKYLKIALIASWIFRFLFVGYFVFFMFGPMLSAQWGVVDDHEILSYLGADRSMSAQEIPVLLQGTEVGKFGEALRFRPSYYVLRLIETSLLGWNPQLWYLARVFSLFLAVLILWYLAERVSDLSTSGIFVVFVLSRPYWSDLFTRLGPAETYGVLPVMTYLYSSIFLFTKNKNKSWLPLVLLHVVSLAILIGIKENFLLLLIPEIFLIWSIWRQEKSVKITSILLLPFAYGMYIFSSLFLAIGHAKKDIYDNSVDLGQRLSLLTSLLKNNDFQFLVTLTVLVVLLVCIFHLTKIHASYKKIALTASICLASCALIFASQYVFYSGQWPTGMRYDFPGILVIPVAYLTAFLVVVSILRIYRVSNYLIFGIKYDILVGMCFYLSMNSIALFSSTRDISVKAANNTRSFSSKVEEIVQAVQSNPAKTIIFESDQPLDYEPLISVAIFLKSYGVTNNIALHLNKFDKESNADPLLNRLWDELGEMERNGSYLFVAAEPSNKECFAVVFSGAKSSACKIQLQKP